MLSVRNPILTPLLLTALLAGCQTEPPVTPANPKPAPEEPADPEAELGVALNATPLEGAAPLRVTFRATATSYTPDYLWDFGDGSAPLYGKRPSATPTGLRGTTPPPSASAAAKPSFKTA